MSGALSDPSVFFDGATGVPEGKQYFYGVYAQDEWKLKPNLTMSYGLRYDYFSPLREAHHHEVNVDTVTGVSLSVWVSASVTSTSLRPARKVEPLNGSCRV
jgi:outer membrane receptor protein involved in Fe transport